VSAASEHTRANVAFRDKPQVRFIWLPAAEPQPGVAEGEPALDPRRVANLAASVVLRAHAEGADRERRRHAVPAAVQDCSGRDAQQLQGVPAQALRTR